MDFYAIGGAMIGFVLGTYISWTMNAHGMMSEEQMMKHLIDLRVKRKLEVISTQALDDKIETAAENIVRGAT